jgi:hypothetical protein
MYKKLLAKITVIFKLEYNKERQHNHIYENHWNYTKMYGNIKIQKNIMIKLILKNKKPLRIVCREITYSINASNIPPPEPLENGSLLLLRNLFNTLFSLIIRRALRNNTKAWIRWLILNPILTKKSNF